MRRTAAAFADDKQNAHRYRARSHEMLVAQPGRGLDRANEIIEGSISAIAARDLDARLSDIDREMPLAAPDEKDDLIREKEQLLKQMQALGRGRFKSFRASTS